MVSNTTSPTELCQALTRAVAPRARRGYVHTNSDSMESVVTKEALGEFEHRVLLAALRLNPDGYSVPIALELEERTGKAVAGAAVHIALRRLEQRGFLESSLRPRTDAKGGRPRRFYKVTERGAERLRDARQCFEKLWGDLELAVDE